MIHRERERERESNAIFFVSKNTENREMASNPSLRPEIGPDGLAREAPVIAYTEKVSLSLSLSLSHTHTLFVCLNFL